MGVVFAFEGKACPVCAKVESRRCDEGGQRSGLAHVKVSTSCGIVFGLEWILGIWSLGVLVIWV